MTNQFAKDLLNWMHDVRSPHEHYFNTLNHNPQLGIPGAYIGNSHQWPLWSNHLISGGGPRGWAREAEIIPDETYSFHVCAETILLYSVFLYVCKHIFHGKSNRYLLNENALYFDRSQMVTRLSVLVYN